MRSASITGCITLEHMAVILKRGDVSSPLPLLDGLVLCLLPGSRGDRSPGTVISLPARAVSWCLLMSWREHVVAAVFFPKQLRVAPVTLGGKAGQVFEVLMMISLSKPAQTINGLEMLIRRRA